MSQDMTIAVCHCGRTTSADVLHDWGHCETCEKIELEAMETCGAMDRF